MLTMMMMMIMMIMMTVLYIPHLPIFRVGFAAGAGVHRGRGAVIHERNLSAQDTRQATTMRIIVIIIIIIIIIIIKNVREIWLERK
jgi:hypothetical protein